MNEAAPEAALKLLAEATEARPVRLGRYDVVGRLGRGGMGTVYQAVDAERGTKVALKTLSVVDAKRAVDLKREFRTVADLSHDNLVPVFELASDRGIWFFTMEYVEGVTLVEWARKNASSDPKMDLPVSLAVTRTTRDFAAAPESGGKADDTHADATQNTHQAPDLLSGQLRLTDPNIGDSLHDDSLANDPERDDTGLPTSPDPAATPSLPERDMTEIRRVFGEIVSGVAALHTAGLRHSDIKPSNILVRGDGRVALVDFGLTQPIDDGRELAVTSGGTPGYMPPEQLRGEPAKPQADWYAVGATLYRVLTGCRPFVAKSWIGLYQRKLLHLPPSPQALLPELPSDLSDLCIALMQPEVESRPDQADLLRAFAGAGELPASFERPKPSLFVGRDEELSTLERAYGRARAGRLTVVATEGPSGIGKSALVTSFLRVVADVDSALVLRGRCYERESVPYKGFDRIIDELSRQLQDMPRERVEALLPPWTGELARVFPALTSVPAIAERNTALHLAGGAVQLRRRGRTALAELLGALRRDRPMVLAIDDLQWADADSAELLAELLRAAGDTPLLVVILCRPREVAANPSLAPYLELCSSLEASGDFIRLPLDGLGPTDARQLAREVLGTGASEELIAFVAKEAHGVPFFIEELSHYMGEREQLGDVEDISLDQAILSRIGGLPPDQRRLVELSAVASSPLPQSVVFEAAQLDAGSLKPLLALRHASLVTWLGAGADDTVSTYHDRIRESVLGSLSRDETLGYHLKLGRALAKRHKSSGWLFDAVRHLGAAASLLDDPAERRAAATMHADAGELAQDAAAFPLAFNCFEAGIALLADDAWANEYDLALRLHAGAVEAAYLSANWSALERRSAEVKANSRSVMDQLVAWEAEIDAFAGRQRFSDAIDTGLSVLRMLGVELPQDPQEKEVGEAVQRTLARLTEVGPDGVRGLPDLDDPRVAAATRIQVRLSPVAYFGRPMLLPLMACDLVTASIDRGASAATPYALSLFGIVLNTVELFPTSHAWGQLALELLERWPDRRLEAATRHILNNLVCCWMVPLSSVLDSLLEVFQIGCRTGDYEYASYAAHGYVHNSMYAGRPLEPLLDKALFLGEQMQSLGQVNAYHVHVPCEQVLKGLTGRLADPRSLDDDSFDEEAHLAEAVATGSRSGAYLMHHLKGLTLFLFGDPLEAFERFDLAKSYSDAVPSIWHLPIRLQFTALAACAAYGKVADQSQRDRLRASTDECLAALRRLAGHTPINFAHRVTLVEAELARIDGSKDAAVAAFDRAIEQAQEGSWVNDVALANELAARCYDDPNRVKARLRAARAGYAAWGASAKAEQLSARIAAGG